MFRPVCDGQFHDVVPTRHDSLSEYVVLDPLIFFVSEKQCDEAVKTCLESNGNRSLSELAWNLQRSPGADPVFNFVQSSRFAKANEPLGILKRQRFGHQRLA